MKKAIIDIRDMKRNFQMGNEIVHALKGINLTIREGEFVTIMGPSGSGKSTLLNILGCLDRPSSGDYILDGISVKERRERAIEALISVGLEKRLNHLPSELSGGQQQRVAIARSLVNQPVILLADEATGNLDTKTSYEVMELFQRLNDQGSTIGFVTHEDDIAQFSKRTVVLKDGHIISDKEVTDRLNAKEQLAQLRNTNDE